MSEIRYEVWYENDEKLKRPCKVPDGFTDCESSDLVRIFVGEMDGSEIADVPAGWLHPVEPEIAEGTLVYAWSDMGPSLTDLEIIGMTEADYYKRLRELMPLEIVTTNTTNPPWPEEEK